MLTKDKIIEIFCFIDDLLKTSNHYEDSRRHVSDSEILTTAVASSLYFGGHQDKARQFMKMTGMIPNMLDKSRFNRRFHAISELIYSLFMQVGYYFKYISCEMSYVLDSFPVAVCDNIRIANAKLLKIQDVIFKYQGSGDSKEFEIGPINLEVKRGEILFIVGGNGSGKTTFAKLLTGLYEADEGSIFINNEPIKPAVLGEYFSTVFSPSCLFSKLYNIDTSEKEDEVRDYLKILGLEEKVTIQNNSYSTINLSGGQRKRLALLQCYLEDSPIYLFDEWAADQDPEYRFYFYRTLLPEMRRKGKIVIAITHDDHYFDVADKVLKMNQGVVEDYFQDTKETFVSCL